MLELNIITISVEKIEPQSHLWLFAADRGVEPQPLPSLKSY